MMFLGISTYLLIRKIYPGDLNKDLHYLLVAIGINVLLGGVAILTKSFLISNVYYLILFEVLTGAIYLLILWLLKTEWIRQVPEKIKVGNKL